MNNLNTEFPLVSLYGANYIENDWTLDCMRSWQNIENIAVKDTYILPDNSLNEKENKVFLDFNFKILDDIKVNEFLKNYPALKQIREKDVTWRKIIDPAIIFSEAKAITLIDTDVFIRDKVLLPLNTFDIVYMREDIPAYRANWKIVWHYPMVPALNAGIVIVNPKLIDFDFLEFLVSKYILGCKNLWWSEQSAWSCLAGRTSKRGLFSGESVRVTSAMKLRKPAEMIKNEYKYFGGNKMIKEYEEFHPYLEGGSIFHFAGPGKYLFKDSLEYLQSCNQASTVHIKATQENTLTFLDKILISARLYLKEKF